MHYPRNRTRKLDYRNIRFTKQGKLWQEASTTGFVKYPRSREKILPGKCSMGIRYQIPRTQIGIHSFIQARNLLTRCLSVYYLEVDWSHPPSSTTQSDPIHHSNIGSNPSSIPPTSLGKRVPWSERENKEKSKLEGAYRMWKQSR